MNRLGSILCVVGLLAACSAPEPIITTCEAGSGIEPHCGFQNPEDLALLPDGRTIVASQFGVMDGSKPGNLAVFDVDQPQPHVAFRGANAKADDATWGDPACPGPPDPAFAPHGIDLERRSDGRLQLLVVNHGGREAVEFFEVEADGLATTLTWRGCAVAPDDHYLNDVVHTPEDGFLATHMMSKQGEATELLKGLLFGSDIGWVVEWVPEAGWTKVAGTDAPFPNGLELAADGRHVYVNVYLAGEVRKIDRKTGELVATALVSQPDNVVWSTDGSTLLVASHLGGVRDAQTCMEVSEGSCGMRFEIVALEPTDMTRSTLLEHAGAPMGAATVALQVGDDLWLGTFAGDRVARVPGAASQLGR